jgi:hypothetical protein
MRRRLVEKPSLARKLELFSLAAFWIVLLPLTLLLALMILLNSVPWHGSDAAGASLPRWIEGLMTGVDPFTIRLVFVLLLAWSVAGTIRWLWGAFTNIGDSLDELGHWNRVISKRKRRHHSPRSFAR